MVIKKKKILIIINIDSFLITHRLPIVIEAIKQGYEIHLACQTTIAAKQIKKYGIKIHPLKISRSRLNPIEIFFTFLDILRVINIIQPDILHLISIKPILLGGIASYFIKRKTNIISSVSGLGTVFIQKGFKAKFVRIITIILYKITFKNKKITCIVQNKDDLNFLNKITSLPSKNFILIPGSGVDLTKFKINHIEHQRPIILFPSRLLVSKGIIQFIEASRYLKDEARFVISGAFDSDSNDALSKDDLNIYLKEKIIEYWGFSNDMYLTISKSSIVVLPSYREGLPKVLCEAAACGKPIITTDVPGCRESIINGVTGILIPKNDTHALIKAIKDLLKDKKYANKLGKNGRDLAEAKFDINKIVSSHMDIYNNI